jgi:hypothetical protein
MTVLIMILMVVVILFLMGKLVSLHIRREKIRSLFIRLVNNFENEGVVYWVDFGTLLGITRDRDIIFGDNDGDVCVYDTPENKSRISAVVNAMGGEYLNWGAYRVYNNGVFIDIYVIKETSHEFHSPTGEIVQRTLIEPVKKQQCVIGSRTVNLTVPNDVHGVLENRYGLNWQVQKRKWYTLYIDFEKDFSN